MFRCLIGCFLSSVCLIAQTPTQVDYLSQVKNKYAFPVTQNAAGTNGGYQVFSPISYSPYDSPGTCYDLWGNKVQQPLPAAGQPAFGLQDVLLWNSLSPSLQFAAGTVPPAGDVFAGLVQKLLITSVGATTIGPCGAPLPVNSLYGLNTNGYFFGRGGLATDNPAYNSIQSLQGGILGNSLTMGVYYPIGTTVCRTMSGATCATSSASTGEYLGGHVDSGHSNGPPQGTSIQASTNPFSSGEGLVAGMIYYDDGNHCESVYSGTSWGCIGITGGSGVPNGPTNAIQTNNSGGVFGGFSALTYNPGSNVVTLAGSAGQGMIAPLFNANAGGTNLEFQGSQFSVLGNGHVATNGWLDFGENTAPPTQAAHAILYADSGTHQLLLSLNNSSFFPLGGVAAPVALSASLSGNILTVSQGGSGSSAVFTGGAGVSIDSVFATAAHFSGGAFLLNGAEATTFAAGTTTTFNGTVAGTHAQPLGSADNPTFGNLTVTSCTGCTGGGGNAPLVFTGLAGAPSLSASGNANLYFNTTNGDLEASYSTGAYTGLKSPLFNCTATGSSSCIQQAAGTFSVTGAGAAAFQSLTVGTGGPFSVNTAGTVSTSGGVIAGGGLSVGAGIYYFNTTGVLNALSLATLNSINAGGYITSSTASVSAATFVGAGTVFVDQGFSGVTCSGTPTSSFATSGGIVIHC